MMAKQRQLNLLGLAMRSRNLVSGDELVEQAIKKSQVALVCCASDASAKTRERYIELAKRHKIVCNLSFNRQEISQAIGRKRTICGITNRGMVKTFLSYEKE